MGSPLVLLASCCCHKQKSGVVSWIVVVDVVVLLCVCRTTEKAVNDRENASNDLTKKEGWGRRTEA